jgi:transposase
VLIEASTESEWVARCIESLGHEVVVADPNYAPMYGHGHHRRQKTDRRDALALAEACRIGAYRKTHRSSDRSRDLRARLAVRDALVRTRVRFISLIRALLRREGLRVASGTAEHFPKRVATIALPAHVHQQVHPLLTVMEQVTEELRELDHALSSIAKEDEVAARLCSVPSIGPVTAIAFATTVDDPHRFQTAHQLQSYLGLVPRERSSGEKVRKGRITKTGSRRERTSARAGSGQHHATPLSNNAATVALGRATIKAPGQDGGHRGAGAATGRGAVGDDA